MPHNICCYYCVFCFIFNFYVQFTSIFDPYVIDVRLSCLLLINAFELTLQAYWVVGY